MKLKEIRWKQRFQNFENAYKLLEKYADQIEYTELERAGLMQLFETTFELAWKVAKDYLEAEGYNVATPREAIKQGFEIGLITEGDLWMEALADRNLTTHTYNEEDAIEIVAKISEEYTPMLEQLFLALRKKSTEMEKEG